MCGVRSGSTPALTTTGRPPLSELWLAYAANTDAASIWGTSTAASSVAVSRRSSSDRVDLELQSTSHRGMPHFLLSMQSTVKAKGLVVPGALGAAGFKDWRGFGYLGGQRRGIRGSHRATSPVQLGCQARAARLPRPASKASSPTPTLDGAAPPSLHRDVAPSRVVKARLLRHPWTRRIWPDAVSSSAAMEDTSLGSFFFPGRHCSDTMEGRDARHPFTVMHARYMPQGSSLLPPTTVAAVHSSLSLPVEFGVCYVSFFWLNFALDAVRSDRSRNLDGSLMRFTFKMHYSIAVQQLIPCSSVCTSVWFGI